MSTLSGKSTSMADTGRGPELQRVGVLLMVVLLCSNCCMGLMFTAVGPVLPALMGAFGTQGDGALNAQLIMTTPGVGIILAGAPVGWLTQRFGPERVVRWALLGFALSGTVGMLLHSLPAFLATRFLLGVSAVAIATATLALVGDRFHDEARAKVLSWQAAAGAAFGFLSLLVSGAVAEAFGWRASFGLYGLGLLVLACALASLPLRPVRAPLVRQDGGAGSPTSGSLWPLWPVFLLIVGAIIYLQTPLKNTAGVEVAEVTSSVTGKEGSLKTVTTPPKLFNGKLSPEASSMEAFSSNPKRDPEEQQVLDIAAERGVPDHAKVERLLAMLPTERARTIQEESISYTVPGDEWMTVEIPF